MKTVVFVLFTLFIFSCNTTKKEQERSLQQDCNLLINNVMEFVAVDSSGQLVSSTILIDSLSKYKNCFIGLSKNRVIEIFGSPSEVSSHDMDIKPSSISYSYSQGCLPEKKACKQLFFILDSKDVVIDLKILEHR